MPLPFADGCVSRNPFRRQHILCGLTDTYDADGTRTALGGSLARSELPPAIADARYDATNRLTQKDGVAYTYDANGNLTSDGISTYVWNARH